MPYSPRLSSIAFLTTRFHGRPRPGRPDQRPAGFVRGNKGRGAAIVVGVGLGVARKSGRAVCAALLAAVAALPCLIPGWWERPLLVDQFENVLGLVGTVTLLLAFRATRRCLAGLGAVAGWAARVPGPRFAAAAGVLFFALAGRLSGDLFSRLPHVSDSQMLYVQSKMLAAGRLALPGGPLMDFFAAQFSLNTGTAFFGMYPPGHPLALALGQLAGVPWAVNPALGALFVLAVYHLGREVGGQATGRIAAALALVSPFVVFMSSEYMSHASALPATTLFALFYVRLLKRRHPRDAVLAGASLGWLAVTRLQCAAFVGFFYAAHALALFTLRHRRFAAPLTLLAYAATPFLGYLLYYNRATTGDPFVLGQSLVGDRISWTWLAHWGEWHGLPLADLERAGVQAGVLNQELFCWPVPSLTFALLLFLFGAETRYAYVLAATFLSACLGLTLTEYTWTNLFGPRYLYETSGVLIALTALGLRRLPAVARARFSVRVSAGVWRGLLAAGLIALPAYGLVHRTGELYRTYQNNYWEGNVGFYRAVVREVAPPALVFVEGHSQFQYVSFTLPPADDAPVVFARDLGNRNGELRQRYPDRRAYRVGPIGKPTDANGAWSSLASGVCLAGAGDSYLVELN